MRQYLHVVHTHVCVRVCWNVNTCTWLTHNLKGNRSFVLKTVHFNSHLVNTRVLPLRGADEQDTVLVTIPDVDPLCV